MEKKTYLDEEVVIIASPKIATEMAAAGVTLSDGVLICCFANTDNECLVVRKEDWYALIDKAEVWHRNEKYAGRPE